MEKDLEKQIEETTARINTRQTEIETDINQLIQKIKTYTHWAWGFVWLGFGVTAYGVVSYVYAINDDADNYRLNLLGDFMAGTVASVWALAGLFFIYVAFLGQKQQLLHQQLELMYNQLEVKYTRLELSGQKAEMAQQNETLKQQKFENTFFQLLSNHNSIVNSMDTTSVTKGRDCFVDFYHRLKTQWGNVRNRGVVDINDTVLIYIGFYNSNVGDLSHYFRNLYHIVKFVDESEIENKKRYTNFIRAQLSAGELAILFYNCLSKFGIEKFKPLIEKYSLLKNIDKELLFEQNHLNEYNEKAFK